MGDKVKYLDIIFDPMLDCNYHVAHTFNKVNIIIKMLYPLINRKSSVNIDNKINIFKSIFLPIVSYAAPLWSKCAKCHIKKYKLNKIIFKNYF